jgi:excisionase family DNA binding protein
MTGNTMNTSTYLSEDYAPRPEAARILGVCEQTLIRWGIESKGPPVTRLGRRVLYRRSSLKTWLASLEKTA